MFSITFVMNGLVLGVMFVLNGHKEDWPERERGIVILSISAG